MPLDPVTAQINDLIQATRREAPPMTPELMRTGYEQLMAQVGTTQTTCTVTPLDVGGLDSLVFTPPEPTDGLLIWFHGGGWVISEPRFALNEVDRLAAASRCRTVSVGYRLAPEHPMPTPQRDALAATAWCLEHADELGVDPGKVAVGGDSAGGHLAAIVAQRVPAVRAQVLVYPCCDLRPDHLAQMPHPEGFALDRAAIEFFVSCSLGDADVSDPLVSPLAASPDVLAGVAPACVVTAEYDPLRDDGRLYAQALAAGGVHVEELRFDDQMHLFFSLPELLEGARTAIEGCASFVSRQLATT